jgi:hypothetical protein
MPKAMRREDLPENAPIRQIRDWPTFFEQVRRRPALWLGSASLTALQSLMAGIGLAELLYDIPERDHLKGFPFSEFEEWADKRFNPDRLSINSFGMAKQIGGSENEAFDLWFSWYDEFQSQRST